MSCDRKTILSRRNILKLASGSMVGLFFTSLGQSKLRLVGSDHFDAVFINYFPHISENDLGEIYGQFLDLKKINKINDEFVKSGQIIRNSYEFFGNYDVTRYRFISEQAFLDWDRCLYMDEVYSHRKFLNSGLKTWSNIPVRLMNQKFYTT